MSLVSSNMLLLTLSLFFLLVKFEVFPKRFQVHLQPEKNMLKLPENVKQLWGVPSAKTASVIDNLSEVVISVVLHSGNGLLNSCSSVGFPDNKMMLMIVDCGSAIKTSSCRLFF